MPLLHSYFHSFLLDGESSAGTALWPLCPCSPGSRCSLIWLVSSEGEMGRVRLSPFLSLPLELVDSGSTVCSVPCPSAHCLSLSYELLATLVSWNSQFCLLNSAGSAWVPPPRAVAWKLPHSGNCKASLIHVRLSGFTAIHSFIRSLFNLGHRTRLVFISPFYYPNFLSLPV